MTLIKEETIQIPRNRYYSHGGHLSTWSNKKCQRCGRFIKTNAKKWCERCLGIMRSIQHHVYDMRPEIKIHRTIIQRERRARRRKKEL